MHRPQYGLGLNQVVADYFDMKFVEFDHRSQYLPQVPDDDQESGKDSSIMSDSDSSDGNNTSSGSHTSSNTNVSHKSGRFYAEEVHLDPDSAL